MEKLPVVESAKELMTEAVAWSVMKWLREKKTVRKVADQANAALDQLHESVKHRWPDDVQAAYGTLIQPAAGNHRPGRQHKSTPSPTNPQLVFSANKVRDAEQEAHRARMDAEETFDIAEKQLSTALAREGCRKAIRSWELHENAIRRAEDLIPRQ